MDITTNRKKSFKVEDAHKSGEWPDKEEDTEVENVDSKDKAEMQSKIDVSELETIGRSYIA
ncbi:MAG: hypothetical protein ACFE7R_11755 [Candidatus Hodarchaeota archaeon]